jgi:hypothetical protein
MEKINLSKISPDPLTEACSQTDEETITVTGYVRSTDEDTISVCEDQTSRSFVEYPRRSIVGAFKEDEDPAKVTFLVKSGAIVRIIRHSRADKVPGKKTCGCSDPDVREARPLGSIHPALAEFAREVARIKREASGDSIELKCAEARADCFRKGGTVEECNGAFIECLITNTFA